MKHEMGTLHVYGQQSHHDDLSIYGDRAGLTTLRDAINAALDKGQFISPAGDGAFQNDGEGYYIGVVMTTPAETESLPHAYHDPLWESTFDLRPLAAIDRKHFQKPRK